MPTLETHNGYALWYYIPSLPAAIIFAVIFGIVTIGHGYLMFKNRAWFCIPFLIGGIFEVIGYIGRALAYNATGQLPPYILQSMFLLLAPIFFAATLYMTLSRVVLSVDGETFSPIRPRWLSRIFVTGDIVSFLIQGGGAGMLVQAKTPSDSKTGQNIITGGLVFQILMFAMFVTTAIVFHVRAGSYLQRERFRDVPWASTLYMLYATSAFVIIRNIFRTVEYAMGQENYLTTSEWTTYIFDALLMLATMVLFGLRYPSRLNQGKRVESSHELIEERGEVVRNQSWDNGPRK